MGSVTTKPDKHGWYYTFKKRKDNTIIIELKRLDYKRKPYVKSINDIHIYGDGVFETLKDLINS